LTVLLRPGAPNNPTPHPRRKPRTATPSMKPPRGCAPACRCQWTSTAGGGC
jgi:hypothetical protein